MPMKQDDYDGTVRSEVEHDQDVLKVRLNDEERAILKKCQEILEQPKQSTALKQLALIGANVVQDEKTGKILEMIFDNKRKNKRTGVIEYEA